MALNTLSWRYGNLQCCIVLPCGTEQEQTVILMLA